jgi:ribosomal protein S18 acetylase RimI-like enzyme
MRIVRAGMEELDFLVRSQLALAQETESLLLDPETVRLGVRAVLENPEKGSYRVMKTSSGESIACALILTEWSDWRNGTVLWIHSLYVDPSYRGQGVYRKLYAEIQSEVGTDPRLRGIRLYVDKNNVSAKAAYLKLGMNADHYELFEWMKP